MTIEAPRTSVLASLTAEVMAEKKAAARTLTPVEGEVMAAPVEVKALDVAGAFAPFPYDQLGQTLLQVSAQLRHEAATLVESAEHIEKVAGIGPNHPLGVPQEAPEQPPINSPEFQQGFEASFREKSLRAQAEVFGAPVTDSVPQGMVLDTPVWRCPTHDVPGIEKVSPKGRSFVGCPDCNLFER